MERIAWNLQGLPLKHALQPPGANVYSIPIEIPAAARARWLAEIAETLDEAERLLNRLNLGGEHLPLMVELELRIEAARQQVQSLRMGRQLRDNSDPNRINLHPWKQAPLPGA
jgi:hypothetical protein